MVHWVKSLEDACWRTERQFVRCLVEAKWNVDGQPVEVEPGLVISFAREDDATYFLTLHEGKKYEHPRAEPVFVTPGMIVALHFAADAAALVKAGKAEPMSEADVVAAVETANAARNGETVAVSEGSEDNGETDDMMKPSDLENKGGVPAPETKKAAPKPKAPKGKK